jgi:hypothetical protein
MVEHLPGEVEYRQATTYLRTVIAEIDVSL